MNWIAHHLTDHLTALQKGDLVKLGVLFSADVLILFSIISLAVIIERALGLSRARRLEESEYAALRDLWRRESNEMVRSRVAVSQAPSASAVRAGLELQSDLLHSGSRASTAKPETVRELVREAIGQGLEGENAKLSRNLPILATVASTAPYIGLFGTVLGILSAFARIAQTNQTGASVVAAPIAEALTATGLGLGVAIPAVMAYNYFSGRVGDLMLHVETHALDLAARLSGTEAGASAGAPSGRAPDQNTLLTPAAPELVMTSATGVEANHAR
ncbi:MAG: biopolymer transport protein TolQ [Abditibacteriota bacterium]|nr:biopolymer transport protein TolQ [Abditibacteriota bacterium]